MMRIVSSVSLIVHFLDNFSMLCIISGNCKITDVVKERIVNDSLKKVATLSMFALKRIKDSG